MSRTSATHHPEPEQPGTLGATTRRIAQRIRNVPQEVVAAFSATDPAERAARLRHTETEVFFEARPVHGWLERRRPAETAALFLRRLDHVFREAERCAATAIPEYAGGTIGRGDGPPSPGARRTAALVVQAGFFADSLADWAADMDAEADQQSPVEDESAYRPANEFLRGAFDTPKKVTAALKKHPWIRRRKPSPQRLEIHAGDWMRMEGQRDAAGFDALDVPAKIVDEVVRESQGRQNETRRKKGGK
jgi:hypothetical protein